MTDKSNPKLAVAQGQWDEARELAPSISEKRLRLALGGPVNEQDVLRLAIRLGLDHLKREHAQPLGASLPS